MGQTARAQLIGSAKGLEESAQKLSEDTGRSCLATPADVRDPKAVQAAVKATVDKFGRIDFVVCGELPSWTRADPRRRWQLVSVL